jgi:hypothetical protein
LHDSIGEGVAFASKLAGLMFACKAAIPTITLQVNEQME